MSTMLSEAMGRAMSMSTELSRQARDIGVYPLIYWVGWIVLAYVLLYFIYLYVGPALFGHGPYYGRPGYWGRNNAPFRNRPAPNPFMRMGTGGVVGGMNEEEATRLTASVTHAVNAKS